MGKLQCGEAGRATAWLARCAAGLAQRPKRRAGWAGKQQRLGQAPGRGVQMLCEPCHAKETDGECAGAAVTGDSVSLFSVDSTSAGSLT